MHELSIAENLIEAAESAACAEGASAVVRIRIRLGEWAGVDAQALRFGFDVLARGTLLDGACFEIEEIAARVRCRACGAESATDGMRIGVCGQCGSMQMQLTRGRELEIVEMEIEDVAHAAHKVRAAHEVRAAELEVLK